MRIAIFGATGTIGQQATRQALDAGMTVTAFVRNPSKLEIDHDRLKVVVGDVLCDTNAIEETVKGQDAVIIALGAGLKGRVRADGTSKIVQAMKRMGVRQLICQSTMGAGESAKMLNFKWRWIFRLPLRLVMADHNRQERIVRESGLDWTLVRPAAFTDGPLTGDYKHGSLEQEKLTYTVSRADVAHFLLREAQDQKYVSRGVALSY